MLISAAREQRILRWNLVRGTAETQLRGHQDLGVSQWKLQAVICFCFIWSTAQESQLLADRPHQLKHTPWGRPGARAGLLHCGILGYVAYRYVNSFCYEFQNMS